MAFSYLHSNALTDYVRNSVLPGLSDIIGDASTMMKLLMNNGRTDAIDRNKPMAGVMWDSGLKVERAIRMDLLDSVGWHSDYDVFDVSPNRVITTASMRWARARGHITWTKTDDKLVRAGGTGELKTSIALNLLKDKYNEVYASIANQIAISLYNWVDTAPEPNGIGQLCGRAVSESLVAGTGIDRTWMGIDSDGLDAWDSKVDANDHLAANLVDPASASYLPTVIDDARYAITFGGFGPTNLIMHQTQFRVLENILREKRVINQPITGDLGFQFIEHAGMKIAWDSFMPANHAYMLNMAPVFGGKPAIKIVGRKGGWYDETDWMGSQTALELVKHITLEFNLWCDNPRFFAGIVNLGI